MLNAKNYIKIGFIVSLAAHVGIFALGGYTMDNITKQLQDTTQTVTEDDITYVEPQDSAEDAAAQSAAAVNTESDIVISDTELATTVPDEPEPQPEMPPQDIQPAPKPAAETTKPHKLRKLSDLKNIKIGKIPPSPLKEQDISKLTSVDLQPTIVNKAEPEYDYSLIPAGEEVHIVISYILDDNGTPIQAEIIRPTENTQIPGITPEALEDLKVAALEALQKSKIKPAKDAEARSSPQQMHFNLTSNGSINVTAY